jgi:hypothetical protein
VLIAGLCDPKPSNVHSWNGIQHIPATQPVSFFERGKISSPLSCSFIAHFSTSVLLSRNVLVTRSTQLDMDVQQVEKQATADNTAPSVDLSSTPGAAGSTLVPQTTAPTFTAPASLSEQGSTEKSASNGLENYVENLEAKLQSLDEKLDVMRNIGQDLRKATKTTPRTTTSPYRQPGLLQRDYWREDSGYSTMGTRSSTSRIRQPGLLQRDYWREGEIQDQARPNPKANSGVKDNSFPIGSTWATSTRTTSQYREPGLLQRDYWKEDAGYYKMGSRSSTSKPRPPGLLQRDYWRDDGDEVIPKRVSNVVENDTSFSVGSAWAMGTKYVPTPKKSPLAGLAAPVDASSSASTTADSPSGDAAGSN